MRTIMRFFLKTFRPYAAIIDSWISSGQLQDQWDEFLLEGFRKEGPDASSDMYTSVTDMQASMCKRVVEKPLFLSADFVNKLFLVGESTELLVRLGKPTSRAGAQRPLDAKSSFYREFLKNLVEVTCESIRSETASDDADDRSAAFEEDNEKLVRYLVSSIEKDDLLLMNFKNLKGETGTRAAAVPYADGEEDERLIAKLAPPFLSPLRWAIEFSLNTYMEGMYEKTCKYLIDVLKDEHDLMSYLSLMRKFYLLEDGETMFNFYSDIFDRIQYGKYRQRDSLLTFILQDSLSSCYPQHMSKMSVALNVTSCQRPLELLDGIELCCKIPWPIDMVITPDTQTMYNTIFRFLLQLKWAKYTLDGLLMRGLFTLPTSHGTDKSFSSLCSNSSVGSAALTPELHELKSRIYLLRMNFMHFVNGIHSFIMTETLHTTGIELERQLAVAKDVEEVIATHRRYMRRLHLNCLLDEKDAVVRNAVLWVLNASLEFQKNWKLGLRSFTASDVQKMEKELKQWCMFLGSLKKEGMVPENSILHWLQLYVLPYSSFG